MRVGLLLSLPGWLLETDMHDQEVVDAEGLGRIIHRTGKTIIQDRLRRPSSLPPSILPPGTRKPLWIVADVIQWLREHPDTSLPGHRRARKARAAKAVRHG